MDSETKGEGEFVNLMVQEQGEGANTQNKLGDRDLERIEVSCGRGRDRPMERLSNREKKRRRRQEVKLRDVERLRRRKTNVGWRSRGGGS